MSIVETMAAFIDPDAWAMRDILRGDHQCEERISDSLSKTRAALRAIKPEDFEPLAIGAYRNAYALVVAGETEDQRLARCLAAVMNAVGRGSI